MGLSIKMNWIPPLQTILILDAKSYDKGNTGMLGRQQGGATPTSPQEDSPGVCLLNWTSEGITHQCQPCGGWRWARGVRNGRERYLLRPRSKRECCAFAFRELQVVYHR